MLKNLPDIRHLFDSNGHTRLQAAIAAGIDDVPVVLRAFFDEDTAVEYAIHCQRDRRNLSDADMYRWIAEAVGVTQQGVGKVLQQIADLQFVVDLGDFSNIAAPQELFFVRGGLRKERTRFIKCGPTV